MMFPKKLDIMGLTFKIVHKPLDPDDKKYHGLCCMEKKVIYINPEQSKEDMWRTLFHEMGHATLLRNGFRFSSILDNDTEEILVETYANVIFENFNNMFPKFYDLD